MADHKHGEMNITEQERTFESFMKLVIWTACVIIAAVILLAFINA